MISILSCVMLLTFLQTGTASWCSVTAESVSPLSLSSMSNTTSSTTMIPRLRWVTVSDQNVFISKYILLLGRVSAEDCDRLRAVSAGHPGHGGPGGVHRDEGAVHEVRGGVHHMLQHHREVGDQLVFSCEKRSSSRIYNQWCHVLLSLKLKSTFYLLSSFWELFSVLVGIDAFVVLVYERTDVDRYCQDHTG